MLDEQDRAIDFVLVPWTDEFSWVQRLAKVMGRCAKENGLTVKDEARKVSGESVENLDCGSVDQRQVTDEQRGCRKFCTEASSFRRKRSKDHISKRTEGRAGSPVAFSRQK